MPKNNDLETARNILHNAKQMNMSKDIILKISQKLDEYINAYYRNAENAHKQGDEISEAEGRFPYFTPGMCSCGARRFSSRQEGRSKLISSKQSKCGILVIRPHQRSWQRAIY